MVDYLLVFLVLAEMPLLTLSLEYFKVIIYLFRHHKIIK